MNAYKKIFASALVLLTIALSGTQALAADSSGSITFVGRVVESACSVSEQNGAVLFSGCFARQGESFGATVRMHKPAYRRDAVRRVAVLRSAGSYRYSALAGPASGVTLEIDYK